MEKSSAVISCRVNNLASAIDQAQEYSYFYNVKLVGVPEIKPPEIENASETSQLCLNIFNAIGAEIHPYDIDLAHRLKVALNRLFANLLGEFLENKSWRSVEK